MKSAEDIVRALADSDPANYEDEYHSCSICDVSVPIRASDHKPDCVWRQAVEWVEANK